MIDPAAQREKFIKMTTRPVEALVCELAVPSIMSMLISAAYNMADTFFVARLDRQSPAAVGVVFSYMALIQAIAFFFGQGSANYISRALGARDSESAASVAATGFFSALIVGVGIAASGLLLMDPLLRLLGSTDTILPYARAYMRYILFGTPFIMCSFVMNNQMRLQGNAWIGTIGITTGAVLNIALDPLLIFGLRMGVGGAALATMSSQCVAFVILLRLTRMKDGIPIQLRNFRPTLGHYREIAAGGLPSLGRQGLASFSFAYMNQLAGVYGDVAIAALSVVNRLVMFATSMVLGFGQGFQPVCGFNFGAREHARVRRAFWFGVTVTTCWCATLSALGYAFAPRVIALFRPGDDELIQLGARALRWECLVYGSIGFTTMANMYLQNTRRTFSASILAASRQGLILVPALSLGRRLLGLSGILSAQPVADALTFCLSLPLALGALRSMGRDGPSGDREGP